MARSLGVAPCACLAGSATFFSRCGSLLGHGAILSGRTFQKLSKQSCCLLGSSIRAYSSDKYEGNEGPDTTLGKASKPYAWQSGNRPKVCILGGGFGGLYTALRLESLVWPSEKRPQILLVDQSDRFVFKPMLYELLTKDVDVWEIAPYFSDLLASTSVKFLKDTVHSVTPLDATFTGGSRTNEGRAGRVCLGSGTQVDYDWLVLALGAESKTDIVPGAAEYAVPFATLEDALEVDKRLTELERERFGSAAPPIDVAVVGSGYCGIELSATVAERLAERGRVQIIDVNSEICSSAPAGNRASALKVLESRNVKLELGHFVTRISPAENNPRLSLELKPVTKRRNPASTYVEVDLVLWTVGSRALLPAAEAGFPVNGRGQADTEDTLRVKGHPRVFAIGDSAGCKDYSGRPLPTTAQVALQQADYAGWNVWAAINDRPLLPFRYQHLGEMMTLGRYNGAVTPSFVEDVTLDGVFGHAARRLAYLYRLPTNEHRVKVGISWLAKSAVDTITFVQDSVAKMPTSSS